MSPRHKRQVEKLGRTHFRLMINKTNHNTITWQAMLWRLLLTILLLLVLFGSSLQVFNPTTSSANPHALPNIPYQTTVGR